jgi:hypothetical protein
MLAASAIVLLAACGADDEDPLGAGEAGETSESEGEDRDETDPGEELPTGEPDDADEDAGTSEGEDGASADGEADEAAPEDAVAPLVGAVSTDVAEQEGDFGRLTVTDVRVSAHEGFDRVVFELDGDDNEPGYHVRYAPEGVATSQGSGEPIEVDGDAALEVALHGVALPDDRPGGVEAWDEEVLAGPQDGVVVEVVEDTIFEGVHTFAVGAEEEQPFLVEHLTDPDRVVIDVHH